jgi:hypothetical protein
MRVPVEWTDRTLEPAVPVLEGREPKASLGALLAIASALEVALSRKLDGSARKDVEYGGADGSDRTGDRAGAAEALRLALALAPEQAIYEDLAASVRIPATE